MQHLANASMPTNKPRISINLTDTEYAELSALAEQYNISMAWIGHKAVLNFLEQNRSESFQFPLTFGKRPNGLRLSGESDADNS